MLIEKALSNTVRVRFDVHELQVIRTMSKLANQTDFMTPDDFLRIHLRHAQDQLDNFPDCTPDG